MSTIDTSTASFFAWMGCASALVFANLGAAYGTAKGGVGLCSMGVMSPGLVMKNIIGVVMAGVLGIYGLIVAVIISGQGKCSLFLLETWPSVPPLSSPRFVFFPALLPACHYPLARTSLRLARALRVLKLSGSDREGGGEGEREGLGGGTGGGMPPVPVMSQVPRSVSVPLVAAIDATLTYAFSQALSHQCALFTAHRIEMHALTLPQ